MIVLLDTDVLIDLVLDRASYAEAAAERIDTREQRPGTALWHGTRCPFLIHGDLRGKHRAKDFLLDLTRFVLVAAQGG